jgi:hypothetical protein
VAHLFYHSQRVDQQGLITCIFSLATTGLHTQADKAADIKLLNSSKLRSGRLAKLKALEGTVGFVGVPDGVSEGELRQLCTQT